MGFGFSKGSIDPWEFVWLANFVRANRVKKILEFGPGMSTYAFLAGGAVQIETYEHHPEWRQKAKQEFAAYSAVSLRTYANVKDLGWVEDRTMFDLAFVDAPPAKAAGSPPYARWNTVQAASKITKRILLHDALRHHEGKILEMMKEQGWIVTIHEVAGTHHPPRGIAEIRLPDQSPGLSDIPLSRLTE